MNLRDAERKARAAMAEHGLTARGWRFGWDNAMGRFGRVRYRDKLLTLSRPLVRLNPEEQVMDTVLHEAAHVLAPRGAGHGWQWKEIARRIGARPVRLADPDASLLPPKKFIGQCPLCPYTFKSHRRIKIWHRRCKLKIPEGADPSKYLVRWTRNKEAVMTNPKTKDAKKPETKAAPKPKPEPQPKKGYLFAKSVKQGEYYMPSKGTLTRLRAGAVAKSGRVELKTWVKGYGWRPFQVDPFHLLRHLSKLEKAKYEKLDKEQAQSKIGGKSNGDGAPRKGSIRAFINAKLKEGEFTVKQIGQALAKAHPDTKSAGRNPSSYVSKRLYTLGKDGVKITRMGRGEDAKVKAAL